MKKLIFILTFLFTHHKAFAAPDRFSVFMCNQGCGLTVNPAESVSFVSTSDTEATAALRKLCLNQHLKLQGDPKCTENKYDLSANERFQRCKMGISPLGPCRVSVNGFGPFDRNYRSFDVFSNSSFDDAELKALTSCIQAVGFAGVCSVAWYSAY